jgi:hypothetical protein
VSEKLKNIDEYFKKHLTELESETSYNRWKTLYWRLFWKKWALWIITTIAVALLISGLLLIYNPPAQLEFSSRLKLQLDSKDPVQHVTGNESNTPVTPDLQKNNLEDKTILIVGNKEIQTKVSDSGKVIPEIEPIYSDEFSTKEATIIQNPQIKLHRSIKQIAKVPIILLEEIAHIENDLPEINKTESVNYFAQDSVNVIKSKHSLNKDFSVGMYLLPAYVAKSLKADEAYDNYLNLRSENEDNILVLGLGTEFRLSINRMYLQSGLEYSVYGENVRYNYTTNTVDLQNSYYNLDTTWVWIYDPPFYGEPRPVAIDSSWNAVYKKIEMASEVKNRFQFIEIPFIAGFHTNTGKLKFEIGTGVSFGSLISCKGYLPDISLNSLTELGKSTPFLQETTFNYILNAGIEYNFNDIWSIILKPNYKQNLQSFFTKDYGISQKYHTFGVIMGIRIKL